MVYITDRGIFYSYMKQIQYNLLSLFYILDTIYPSLHGLAKYPQIRFWDLWTEKLCFFCAWHQV